MKTLYVVNFSVFWLDFVQHYVIDCCVVAVFDSPEDAYAFVERNQKYAKKLCANLWVTESSEAD